MHKKNGIFYTVADYQNGDGTNYTFTYVPDIHGGINVLWPKHSVYRIHLHDNYGLHEIKHLSGTENKYTAAAMMGCFMRHVDGHIHE